MFALETGGRRPSGLISAGIAFQYRDIERCKDLLPGLPTPLPELLGGGQQKGQGRSAAR